VANLPALIRSAAGRAEALDPGNGDAELALIFTTPVYRRWADKERRLRAVIARHPRHWLAHGRLGMVLQQVGRFEEAIASNQRALAIEPMLPISHALIANAYGALGRLQEADATIAGAQAQWPANPALWMVAYNQLLFSGRAREAAAFSMDPARQPSHMDPPFFAGRRALAEAVESGDEGARGAAAAKLLATPASTPFAARALVLLGRGQEAERMLRNYLLGPGSGDGQRSTDMLFLAPLRERQPAGAARALLRHTGLEAYWAQTQTRPDA
jgi:tetratricopeptide (TPR) repeat protein